MALGSISLDSGAASFLNSSPHSFHGGSAADLLKLPPSILRCPFMKAFFGLKAAFLAPTAPAQVTSAKSAPAVVATPADLGAQKRDVHEDSFLKNFRNPQTDAFPTSTVETFDFPFDSVPVEARYANRKRALMVLGLSFHSSVVEMREKLAMPDADWANAIEELTACPHIEEAGVLSTCNRFEVYVSALSWNMALLEVSDWMSRKSGVSVALLRKHLFVLRNQDASRHLFRVASGLDSMVLGEGQIISQVKHVMQMGQGVEGFGRQMTGLFKQAVVAGKRVRSETSIGKGSVSVSSAAVELAAKKLVNIGLKEASMCIVGAGNMAKLLVKHLLAKGCTNIVILNRSEERVTELQRTFPNVDLIYHPMYELERCIEDARVVFTCTTSDTPLVDKRLVKSPSHAAETKYFVDISVPRNVSPCVAELSAAVVLNVDDLQEMVAGNKEERSKQAIQGQAIIDEELKTFEAWQDSLEAVPTIKKLRAYAERIRVSELERYLGKMGDDISVKDKKLVEELSRSIVNKMLHGPMVHLRNDGSSSPCRAEILENMHALERMFDLNSQLV